MKAMQIAWNILLNVIRFVQISYDLLVGCIPEIFWPATSQTAFLNWNFSLIRVLLRFQDFELKDS